ncbi:MAG TPA: antibiotic biosynthesis monooxygenase [Tepidisphaeraceae bacterium]|nr:antibiotic biosynthesis monooxygenase [Tepidisphaeraceae bacterium]
MSWIVLVRQFLSPGAMPDFGEVFERHRALASRSDGFVSLRRLRPKPDSHENEVLLLMEFQTAAHLQAWRTSGEHALVAERYRRLWTCDPETEFFLAEE